SPSVGRAENRRDERTALLLVRATPAVAGRKVCPMKALYATLCALVLAGSASANITVTGSGKVTYTPDLAHARVGTSAAGKTAAEAWQKNAEVVKRLFEAMKKLGIDKKDLQTSNLGVSPRYHQVKDEPPQLIGYTAGYTLTIRVRDLNRLGQVLDRA